MSANPIRMVTGPIAAKMAKALERLQKRRDEWPYWWSFPAPDSKRVHQVGVLASPNPATLTQILAYTVPSGFQFALRRITQLYLGASFTPGGGDIVWNLDVNTPVGIPAAQGYTVQGFGQSTIPYGGFFTGFFMGYELEQPEIIGPLDTLRSKVTTDVVIPVGAPNFFISIFDGLLYPAMEK
jgi:hypothetical protein